MGARTPLPPDLVGATFLVSDPAAATASEKRLRGRDLDGSVWGTRAPAGATSLPARALRYSLRMPADAYFSHATAALLWGIPLPPFTMRDARLDIAVAAPFRAPHARGIRGHSLDLGADQIVELRGLRVTSPPRTWCDLASVVGIHDLVAAGDFVIKQASPLASRRELAVTAATFFKRRGVTLLRQALPLLSTRSESHPESVLRVILHLAGLPAPTVNHVIVDTESGGAMRTDLAFIEFRVVLEYQGDYHRSREQWRKDMTRRSRLEAQGWYVIELNADDLRDPDELVARVLRVLRRRGL